MIDIKSIGSTLFFTFLFLIAIVELARALEREHFVYWFWEEGYLRVEKVREESSRRTRNKKIDGRFSGRGYRYYAVGHVLNESIKLEISLPKPEYLRCDSLKYDTKYDKIFPFYYGRAREELVYGVKNRKGLATTACLVESDSIIPIWMPKYSRDPVSDRWQFRCQKDEKENWTTKWSYQFTLFFVLVLVIGLYATLRNKKSPSQTT